MLKSLCVTVVVRLAVAAEMCAVVVRLLKPPIEVGDAAVIAIPAEIATGSSHETGRALTPSFRTVRCTASYAARGLSHADPFAQRGRSRAGGCGRSQGAARAAVCRGRPATARRTPLLPRHSQMLASPGMASGAARPALSCGGGLARPGLWRLPLSPPFFFAGPWSSAVPTDAAPAMPAPNTGTLLRREPVELERLPSVATLCCLATGLAGPRPLFASRRRPSLAPGRLAWRRGDSRRPSRPRCGSLPLSSAFCPVLAQGAPG